MYALRGPTPQKATGMNNYRTSVQPDKSFFKKLEEKVKKILAGKIYENGYCEYSSEDMARVIFETALQKLSLESNATTPDSDTVFYRLKNSGLNEQSILTMLHESRSLSYEPIIVLLDGHDDMYYGKRRDKHRRKIKVVGTKPKQGSHYAFKYLTAKRLHGEIVYTYPLFGNRMTEDCIRIIDELRKSYTILYVIGDGGFPSSLFLDHLKSINMHFVFRFTSTTTLRSKNIPYNKLVQYTTTYSAPWGAYEGAVPVSFYVCRYQGTKKKDGKRKDFYIISDQKTGPRKLRKSLKERWDIETGFREIGSLTIFTTTRDYILRFFFHVVACIIYNFWIQIKNLFAIRLHDMVLLIFELDPIRLFKILEKRKKYFIMDRPL